MAIYSEDVIKGLEHFAKMTGGQDYDTLMDAAAIVQLLGRRNARSSRVARPNRSSSRPQRVAEDERQTRNVGYLPQNTTRTNGNYNVLGQKRNGPGYNVSGTQQSSKRLYYINYKRDHPNSTVTQFERWFKNTPRYEFG